MFIVSVSYVFSISTDELSDRAGMTGPVQAWCAPDDSRAIVSSVFSSIVQSVSSRFGFLLSLVDFFRRSALRVSPAETRLTVYRRLYILVQYQSVGSWVSDFFEILQFFVLI